MQRDYALLGPYEHDDEHDDDGDDEELDYLDATDDPDVLDMSDEDGDYTAFTDE